MRALLLAVDESRWVQEIINLLIMKATKEWLTWCVLRRKRTAALRIIDECHSLVAVRLRWIALREWVNRLAEEIVGHSIQETGGVRFWMGEGSDSVNFDI